ncbi:hypothetical protein RND71_008304 [Anisodus tanguticus]|uniref:Uncharacterized protein n=1 Tax=Anisodus tanguticus TaxID=243964 RepID=A0AAE1SNH2_9SOLA|nr:hypothetical protein RND71_008304 [Anisodus tanguticus]
MLMDHYTEVLKERVCIVYFFMMGKLVNVDHWMSKKIQRMKDDRRKRLLFGNTLTALILKIDNDLALRSDRVLEAPTDMLDISNVKAPNKATKTVLTQAEERSA